MKHCTVWKIGGNLLRFSRWSWKIVENITCQDVKDTKNELFRVDLW